MSDVFEKKDEVNPQAQEVPFRPDPYQGEPRNKKHQSAKLRGFFALISAGVIGSALTLGVAANTGLFNTLDSERETSAAGITELAQTEGTGSVQVSTSTNSSLADMIENASKAIVGIVNIKKQNNPFSGRQASVESGSGSGVIFKKQGDTAFIVTNNHVIEGASKVEVSLHNGKKTTAEVLGKDALTDLAVLKIDGVNVTDTLEFGDSSLIRPGDQVVAIGNPLGLDLSRTVTQGIVSAVNRDIAVSTSAGEWDLNVIQTDAAITPGNSGGALINTSGQVIGINSLKISDSGVEGLGFAIPSNDVVPIINQLIENGQVNRPFLGVNLADIQDIPAMYVPELPVDVKAGTMITYVEPNSAAEKAGLQKQDVIVAIDGKTVENANDLRKYLYTNFSEDGDFELKVYRAGKTKEINVGLTLRN